mgnify:CR=1 FL=1
MNNYTNLKTNINIMKTSVRIFHWVPRVICIVAILVVSMFALDSFGPGRTVWQQVGSLFMNLIPTFILIALLIVAWKWELIGGIVFTIMGLGLTPFIFSHNFRMNQSVGMSLGAVAVIALPFFFTGILFIISHYMKKRNLYD